LQWVCEFPDLPRHVDETSYASRQRDKGLAMRNGFIQKRISRLIQPKRSA